MPAFCAPLIGSKLRQQARDLAKRRKRRIPRRYIGQFGRHGRGFEVEGGEALCVAPILAGTGEQASDPKWHLTEQRAESRGAMALAGQLALASHACAAMLAGDHHLCRDDLRLDRSHQMFRLSEMKPEIGQASPLIALEACDLDLRRLSGLQLRHQLHPPHQPRHQPTLVP